MTGVKTDGKRQDSNNNWADGNRITNGGFGGGVSVLARFFSGIIRLIKTKFIDLFHLYNS